MATGFNNGAVIVDDASTSRTNLSVPSTTGTGASGTWGISISGSSASTSGNAATATALQTARAINGVNFDGTAAITTPVNTTSVSTNASYFPLFVSSSTNGNQSVNLGTGLTFNPSTNIVSTTGMNLSGLTASFAVVTDSSKNLSSIGYGFANTGSYLVQRDSNGNASAVNFISTTTTVSSNGGTIPMSSGSARIQKITGTSTETFTLPDATTLITGWTFEFNNNSTQSVTVNNKGGSLQATVTSGAYAYVICTDNSTSNGAWDVHWLLPTSAVFNTAGLSVTGTLSASSTINFSNLSASQAVVTDGSKNLTSLSYTNANTASTLVQRDGSGNFSAGTITANLTGNASGSSGSCTGNAATATALQTARAINGVNFDGTAAITVPAAAGTLTGSTLAAGVTASSLTSLGTLGSLTVSGGTSNLGGTTFDSGGNAFLNGSQKVNRHVITSGSSYSVAASDYYISVNKTIAGAITINLDAIGTTIGRVVIIKDSKGDAATNNITITPASGNIDGSSSYVISSNYGSVTLIDDNSKYSVI